MFIYFFAEFGYIHDLCVQYVFTKGGRGSLRPIFHCICPKILEKKFPLEWNCYIYPLVKEEVKEDKSPSLYSGSDTEHIAKKKRAMFQVLYSDIQ